MADQDNTSSFINPEKISSIETILRDFKENARQAEQEGDLFMLTIYNKLLKVMSPIVTNAYERIEREDRASVNKAEKDLRKQRRDGKASSNGQ
jgi:hypothetical protein